LRQMLAEIVQEWRSKLSEEERAGMAVEAG